MRRFFITLLCAVLIATAVMPIACETAQAKKRVVYILKVNTDGARVRKKPKAGDEGNITVSLPKGMKVFYLGKKDAMYKICSEFGNVGYTYKGFLDYYGATNLKNVYVASARTKLYSKPKTSSAKVTTLKKDQYVIVYTASGSWAYVHTLGGKKGYVKVKNLSKP